MRKDYQEPDDYEYEPTPHDDVLEKAKRHYAARPQLDGAEGIAAEAGKRVMSVIAQDPLTARRCRE